ncbi:hypothetical protein A2467_02170 [Candidatus Nomurabacteria bacterium RIFOXYC2_FULL_36_8]|nr:MAG: hypothetical protein UR97_C0004G0152 [Candidatus Nomurabacteria bacterium GW2011_GWE2_36_115]KKP94284.1 MAG: hypothetical protein US00_C0003G0208 [Candidatus Nomurabacteria bacterium GW2011_GWF2_36_126]KKP96589.1 MAG: hypothetical protein US04_C0001G0091 [Candidatus Nomurabacteria bacterium GW2011_GWD2_36_14]KKP99807.1 MAG: hypothetical protein US08_C0001G0490 [Candidatus Nomurabacteria bacterium GW2011_GWF2_36_19]KKQ05247.1 MAG: hypothetical protein US17_C0005G0014 [Candidatus Nomuraba
MEHKLENRTCQNCKVDFTIEPDDFLFYEKIKVPAPTWCPECRMIRRFSHQNTWNLFWRNCDKCGKKTLSMYSSYEKIKVYCQPCWWKDDWDGTEYAMDYDSSRPFLEQVKEIIHKTPYVSLNNLYLMNKNCDYVNSTGQCRDCFMIFWADFCDNVYYSTLLNTLKFSSDCIRGYFSELCYESVGFSRCYRTFFSEECDDCIDVWFSRDCYNCTNCIGCVNLRGESNCIFNIKYTKEEYLEKLKELNLDSWKSLNELKIKSKEFWITKPIRDFHTHSLSVNVSGDYVYESKNSKEMYISNGAEDCKYCQLITVKPVEDCFDYSGWGDNASQIYEGITVGNNSSSVYFSFECWPDSMNLQYCYWNISGKNNLGCVNLKRKQHCILNKEYSKEEFEKLKTEIIEDMKVNPYIDKTGKKFYYGEFFPPEFSLFPYNKSNAMRFFPKTKEEAISLGYEWSDVLNPNHTTTIKASDLPDSILETNDSILNEIIGCRDCGRAYKIVEGELNLLRKMNLPIPHECPKCRENKRFERMDPIKLHKRNCMKCGVGISTPYSKDRPEIVYCAKCYQQEFN